MPAVENNVLKHCLFSKAYVTTAIRLRYDDTTSHATIRRKWSKLRYAFDSTAIPLRRDYDEKLTFHFLLASNWKQARAMRRSRIVVVSQSNRNCNHGIRRSEICRRNSVLFLQLKYNCCVVSRYYLLRR